MIQQILQLLQGNLSAYIQHINPGAADPPIVFGNIGMANVLGGDETYMDGRVVISVVNIMEEATLKNTSGYQRRNNGFEINNPPTFLNLYLLFTCLFSNQSGANNRGGGYLNEILRISQVIEFFQTQSVFTLQQNPTNANLNPQDWIDVRINMELYSMTFEQVNHLWGSLGGKQIPFVMYKASIVPIQGQRITGRGSYLQDIQPLETLLK